MTGCSPTMALKPMFDPSTKSAPRLLRLSLTAIGWIFAAGIIAVAVILFYSRHQYLIAMDIGGPNAINESAYVQIGGIEQWVQIRGQNRNNPILLWLNGGPGFSTIGQTLSFRGWEEDFTLVMWDQRGEGKTFKRHGEAIADTMTVDRMASDGIELTEYLLSHLNQNRLIVMGHSWGSMLAVRMVQRRPDLFAAYVGTGQVVHIGRSVELGYSMALERAQALGALNAVAELAALGPPPYADRAQGFATIRWANELDPSVEDRPQPFSWPFVWALIRQAADGSFWDGVNFSQRLLMDAVLNEDIAAQGSVFDVPVVILHGSGDMVTPLILAKEYFEKMEAPAKVFTVLDGQGHLALLKSPDRFLTKLKQSLSEAGVRP